MHNLLSLPITSATEISIYITIYKRKKTETWRYLKSCIYVGQNQNVDSWTQKTKFVAYYGYVIFFMTIDIIKERKGTSSLVTPILPLQRPRIEHVSIHACCMLNSEGQLSFAIMYNFFIYNSRNSRVYRNPLLKNMATLYVAYSIKNVQDGY